MVHYTAFTICLKCVSEKENSHHYNKLRGGAKIIYTANAL